MKGKSQIWGILARRLVLSAGMLLAVSFLIFAGVNLLPGDFASTYLGREATPEAVAALREQFGLSAPLLERYTVWLTGLLQGDFGTSWSTHAPVADQLWERSGNSILLASVTMLFSLPIALLLGLVSVLYRNRFPDRCIAIFCLIFASSPEFFVGYVAIAFFTIHWGIGVFPATIFQGMGLSEKMTTIVLPVITLMLAVIPHMTRMTRASVLNVVSSPFIETAHLKGLSKSKVLVRHAIPNAAGPIITVAALNMAALVVGVILIEVVFVYPGLGQYLVDAVTIRDMPVVMGCGMVFATIYISLNLLADMCTILSNPRLRYPR